MNGIRRITRALRLGAVATQSRSGISAAQLYVLGQLADGGGASINALAARTMTDRSSVAAVVERLVERGLAGRGTSASDRRRADVWITARGKELLRSAPAAPTAQLAAALARLSDAEIDELAAALDRLVNAMGLEGTPATMLFEEDTATNTDGGRPG